MMQIKQECDVAKLTALQSFLEQSHSEELHYDKQYIMSMMGWTTPPEIPPIQEPQKVTAPAPSTNGPGMF